MTVTGSRHGARVRPVPPPLYYGAAFVAGLLLRAGTVPLDVPGRPATAWAGVAVLVGGVALAAAGVRTAVAHRTTIVPHHPVSALLSTGVFGLTRNPMYTGLAVAYVGSALLVGSWWPVATLPVALLAVRRLVIDPEESYLAAEFGQSYASYRERVRRWI